MVVVRSTIPTTLVPTIDVVDVDDYYDMIAVYVYHETYEKIVKSIRYGGLWFNIKSKSMLKHFHLK